MFCPKSQSSRVISLRAIGIRVWIGGGELVARSHKDGLALQGVGSPNSELLNNFNPKTRTRKRRTLSSKPSKPKTLNPASIVTIDFTFWCRGCRSLGFRVEVLTLSSWGLWVKVVLSFGATRILWTVGLAFPSARSADLVSGILGCLTNKQATIAQTLNPPCKVSASS